MSRRPSGPRRRRFGDFGERVAASHLESKGYTILERNWAVKEGEIDIIASRGTDLVFVEVRSKQGATSARRKNRLRAARRSTSAPPPPPTCSSTRTRRRTTASTSSPWS